jgi:16S rRNA (guanine966-N2)-methyltransferase
MRVIAGEYRGRRLIAPNGIKARPTTDRVKEAMFGVLQFHIAGARVLDAFAGSGALGIEALSRGAAHVDFIEKDPACWRALEENLKAIGNANASVYRGDSLRVMPGLGPYDIMLLDPPYGKELYLPALETAKEHKILNDKAIIVAECRRTFDLSVPMEYNLTKRKNYGDITLFFLEYGDMK